MQKKSSKQSKTKRFTPVAVEKANPLAVAEILHRAARLKLLEPRGPRDNARLLKAALSAQRELGSFTEAYHAISAIDGTIELLRHVVGDGNGPPKDMNWFSIANLLDDCARRVASLHCGIGLLEQFEQEANPEAAHV